MCGSQAAALVDARHGSQALHLLGFVRATLLLRSRGRQPARHIRAQGHVHARTYQLLHVTGGAGERHNIAAQPLGCQTGQ